MNLTAKEREAKQKARGFVSQAEWKSVPLPRAIARLPRDNRGFPVPYVAEWSGERGSIVREEPVPNRYPSVLVYGWPILRNGLVRFLYAGAFDDSLQGTGVPILGRLNPQRQRRCMTERLCQVCGREIPEHLPLWFLGGMSSPFEDGLAEPPLHRSCAQYSAQVCPGLTRDGGRGLLAFKVRRFHLEPSRVDADGEPIAHEYRRKLGIVKFLLGKPDFANRPDSLDPSHPFAGVMFSRERFLRMRS